MQPSDLTYIQNIPKVDSSHTRRVEIKLLVNIRLDWYVLSIHATRGESRGWLLTKTKLVLQKNQFTRAGNRTQDLLRVKQSS
jgi:hypothetical protein